MKDNKNGYILSLDQGTTSSRAILFNHAGHIVCQAQKPITQYYPEAGWVEHDPEEIWQTQSAVAKEVISGAGITAEQIKSIGISNQRETIVVWDKDSGRPVYNAIVWQCRRSTSICQEMIEAGLQDEIRHRTGLLLDPYFSGTKLSWLLRENIGVRALADNGELLFGTIDTWLLWKLTGRHQTDISNASRTLLFNIHTKEWDSMLLSLLGIPSSMLPEVLSSSDDFGTTKKEIFGCEIPVNGVIGDQQAALFGNLCFFPGMVKNTYGTGCFMLLNTGDTPVWSKNNLLTTIAWRIGNKTTYALEGSVFIGGAVIQWLRDELNLVLNASETEALALSVPDSNGVLIIPAFVGLGAPYWDPETRGSILGITRGVNRAHIVRAALESIGYQSEALLMAMSSDYGKPIDILKADGGASVNSFLMQFQADISGISVEITDNAEMTGLGAAYLAGLYCGYWKNTNDIEQNGFKKRRFDPKMNEEERKMKLLQWNKAIIATREYK
jgi:glycerol kinase